MMEEIFGVGGALKSVLWRDKPKTSTLDIWLRETRESFSPYNTLRAYFYSGLLRFLLLQER